MVKKQKPPNPPGQEELGVSDKPLNSFSKVLYDKNLGVATSKAIVNNTHTNANSGTLNNGKGAVANNGKSATPKAANLKGPNFKSDANTMLYGNQDEVALLIGRIEFKDQWVHVVKGTTWYQWTGTYWRHDLKAGGFDTTRKGIRTAINRMWNWVNWMLMNAGLSSEGQDELVKYARKANLAKRAKNYISDIYTLVSKDDNFTVEPGSFDADRNLLGTPDGTVDLTIPSFIDTDPCNYISKQTICAPAKGEPVRWLQFLDEIFEGDQDVIDFIQILCGYALTGQTREEKLFFLYGSGANGKSKFLEALTYIWNDYATRIAPSTLLNKGFSDHPTEIAKLAGARLALGSELPAGEIWDDQKLKELTGGDTLTARFMRQDFFEFKPQFTLLLAGNHIPQMKHVGEAERRRFVLIPFNFTIPSEERDPKLGEKLEKEAGQILTWCIKGAGKYNKSGLIIPSSILKASQDYLDSEDVMGEFLKTQLTAISGKEVELNQLIKAANDWFSSNNHNKCVDPKSLRKELRDRGKRIRRSGSTFYLENYELN
jgi:putative DNA primase/helicase